MRGNGFPQAEPGEMSVMIRWIAAIILATLPASDAISAGDVWFPAGETLPTRVPRNLSSEANQPLRCYLQWDRVALRYEPSPEGRELETAAFLDPFYVVAEGPYGKYWLLASTVDDIARPDLPISTCRGWVPKECCLTYTGEGPESLKDPRTLIFRKAMLVNVLGEAGGESGLRRPVPFVGRPDQQGVELTRRALFEIYYVFAQQGDYLLLGTEPRADRPGFRGEVILGWVPRRRVCPWNTREAVQFNKQDLALRTRACRIFQSRSDLQEYLDLKTVAPIAKEDMAVGSWKYFQPRFPLIDDEDARYQGTAYRGTKLYKVGVIGDVWTLPGGERPERLLTADKVAELKQKAARLKERASIIQVCFVIDSTFSMDRWFNTAASAVTEIVRGIQDRVGSDQIESPRLEISVNFYRDKQDGRLAFEANTWQGAAAAVSLLTKQSELTLGGGKPYEMVFGGICKTLRESPFRREAVKVLVLIGDDGNDPDDSQFTVDRVFQEIVEAGGPVPIGFFAVAVGDQRATPRRAFTEQAREIARRLTEHQVQSLLAGGMEKLSPQVAAAIANLRGQVVVTDRPDQVVDAINDRFQLAVAEMTARRKQLGDLQSGAVPAAGSGLVSGDPAGDDEHVYGLVWQQQMLDLIRSEGLEPLLLAREGVQLFSEGWVAEYDPWETAPLEGSRPPQIRHVALMHKSEMMQLAVVLGLAMKRWRPQALERTWQEALDAITGGNLTAHRENTPAELIKMHLFGVKVKSDVLALTFDEISRISAARLVQLRRDLELNSEQINDVLDEREADYQFAEIIIGPTRTGIKRTNDRPRKYWWGNDQIRSDLRAWVDRDILP